MSGNRWRVHAALSLILILSTPAAWSHHPVPINHRLNLAPVPNHHPCHQAVHENSGGGAETRPGVEVSAPPMLTAAGNANEGW